MENISVYYFTLLLAVGKPATKIHVRKETEMCLKVSLMDNFEADCGMKYNSLRIVASGGLI